MDSGRRGEKMRGCIYSNAKMVGVDVLRMKRVLNVAPWAGSLAEVVMEDVNPVLDCGGGGEQATGSIPEMHPQGTAS